MDYSILMYYHLATVIPSFLVGTILLVMKKGTNWHRNLGKGYMLMMLFTGLVTLLMPAEVGPRLFNHFGWLHSFSVLTLYLVPTAYIAARKGQISRHKRKMIGLYIGGILIAGSFTFVPGRFMHQLFFG